MPVWIFYFFIVFMYFSCAPSLKKHHSYISHNDTVVFMKNPAWHGNLQVQYLGCGGLLIKKDSIKILVDPFFSNPGPFVSLIWKKLRPDTTVINKALSNIDIKGLNNVLITHGHYDHILDVPYIYKNFLTDLPPILCSQTSSMMLTDHGIALENIVDVYDNALGKDKPGKWMYYSDSTYRILPILSEHAPHISVIGLKLHLQSGKYDTGPNKRKGVRYFQQGHNLSFLIDFLDVDKSSVIQRVQVLTGGASSSSAYLIAQLPEAHHIDILVLTVGLHNNAPDYPQHILEALDPDFVIAAHWEDFFQPYFKKKKNGVRMTNHGSFANIMNSYKFGRWIYPFHLTTITFSK